MERHQFLGKLLVFALVAELCVAGMLCSIFPLVRDIEGFGWLLVWLPARPLAPMWDDQIFNQRILDGWIQWLALAWSLLFLGAMIVICRFSSPSRSMLVLARTLVAAWLLSGGLTIFLEAITHS
jgi:hypothetical protein